MKGRIPKNMFTIDDLIATQARVDLLLLFAFNNPYIKHNIRLSLTFPKLINISSKTTGPLVLKFISQQTYLSSCMKCIPSELANLLQFKFILLLSCLQSKYLEMCIRSCPVLYPTPQQFTDFYHYVHQLDRLYKQDYGMVKIVPPAGWIPQSKNYHQKLDNLIVKNPIEQNVQGSGGFYESKNIVQNKMSLKEYRRYAEKESKTVEGKTVDEKQKLFWKTITYSPPIYGADLTGTLMDQNAQAWNFNNLDSLLKYALTEKVKGVTKPYCYIGSWKAFFSWHKQDLDLAAINYIHQGASKIWYSIAECDSHVLQEQARSQYKQQSRKCEEFMRHKTFLINPELIQRKYKELKISRVEHKAGEIMIVFGGAYHCGFNCGFNIAEAVNYATIDWLKQLTSVRFCTCFKKSVRGEIESILYNLQNSAIYDRLSKTEQFAALQHFVLELQSKEGQNYAPVQHEQVENMNINSKMFPVVQNVVKKETVRSRSKQKDSKKIKKDKPKKGKRTQEQYVPSYKCKVDKSSTPRTKNESSIIRSPFTKKLKPGQLKPLKAVQEDHELCLQT